jgi:hypothetical protein
MLKAGSDSFLETGKPPAIVVCDHRYVFNPPAADKDLDPSAPCPPDIASTSVAEDAQWSKSTISVSAPSPRPQPEGKETFSRKRFVGPRKVHKEARSRRLVVEQARDVAGDQYIIPVVTTTFRLPR